MAQPHHTPRLAETEEALTVLFCIIDDAYVLLNPRGARCYEELIDEAALGDGVARRLLGDLAYRSKELREALAEVDILLATERSERRAGIRQQVEIAISSLKRVFCLGETLATTLVGLATRIAAKICAYTYACSDQQDVGAPSRSHQGVVGMKNLATYI